MYPSVLFCHICLPSDGHPDCHELPMTVNECTRISSSISFYLPGWKFLWDIHVGAGLLYHEMFLKLWYAAAAAAKSPQSCPTLCDPRDGSPPGSPIPGILQARTLEWVAISSSNARKWRVKVKSLIQVRLLATPWTAAHQAPMSMGFSRQEYWSGVPLPSLKLWYNLP